MEDVKYSMRYTGSDVKSLNTRCSSCYLEEGEFHKSKARYTRNDKISSLSHKTPCFHSIVPNKWNFSNQNLREKNSVINATLHLKFQRTCSSPRPPHTHIIIQCAWQHEAWAESRPLGPLSQAWVSRLSFAFHWNPGKDILIGGITC